MKRSEAEVRSSYPDLLDTEDPELVRLAQILDAGYGMHAAPSDLRERAPGIANQRHATSRTGPVGRSLRSRFRWAWHVPVVAVVVLAFIIAGASFALTKVTNLGKPVNIQSTASYFPLSGFHRVKGDVRQGGKPVLLFLGALGPTFEPINAERWPIVKALDQFGTLSGVTIMDHQCFPAMGVPEVPYCTVPTFNLSRAHYSSRYLVFINKDLIRARRGRLVAFQHLSPVQLTLFRRYARASQPVCGTSRCSFADIVSATINNQASTRTLPLIVIGDYVETVSQDISPADFARMIALTPLPGRIIYRSVMQGLPFKTVQDELLRQRDLYGSHLVETVNAEANIITALICHADGKRPASVCNRPVIRAILKQVK